MQKHELRGMLVASAKRAYNVLFPMRGALCHVEL
jgi:hypothetical protein